MSPDEIISTTDAASKLDSATKTSLTDKVDEMMYMDANDSLGTTMSFMTKDVDNLIQGISTYGFSEMIVYYETIIWDLWMFFAETQGIGMGFGICAASLVSRALFAPIIVYSVSLFVLYHDVHQKLY